MKPSLQAEPREEEMNMSKFEVYDFVEGTREMIFMAMDEHGIMCEDGHWLTEAELYGLSDDAVISMYESIYGKE